MVREWRKPRIEKNRENYSHTCEWCGKQFGCSRPDGRTCSNACKLRFTRWKRAVVKVNGSVMLFGPRGEEWKRWEAIQPEFKGRFSYKHVGSQK